MKVCLLHKPSSTREYTQTNEAEDRGIRSVTVAYLTSIVKLSTFNKGKNEMNSPNASSILELTR